MFGSQHNYFLFMLKGYVFFHSSGKHYSHIVKIDPTKHDMHTHLQQHTMRNENICF